MFRLEGHRSFLVPFEERHLRDEEYFGWVRDYEVIKTINRLEYVRPVSFAELKEYCEGVMRSKSDVFLAIYSKGEERFIGTIRASRIDYVNRTADVGILIGNRAYWGRGIATDALGTVCRYLFERLGLRKVTAGLMRINPAMLKVFAKLGFQEEGVFRKQDWFEGDYVDHVYLGCFREEFVPPAH